MEDNANGLKVGSDLLEGLRILSREYRTFDLKRKNSMTPERRKELYDYFVEKIAKSFSKLIILAEKNAEFDLLASFYLEIAPKKATVICGIMDEEKKEWPAEKAGLLEEAIKRRRLARRGKVRSGHSMIGW